MATISQYGVCLGFTGRFSLARDFFGLLYGVPSSASVSVLQQIALLKGKFIHVNIILVGTFSTAQVATVDRAIIDMRAIYAQVGFGIGRIYWAQISSADAGDLEVIDCDDEAYELTNSWNGPSDDGVDIFVVKNSWNDDDELHGGISTDDASCEKDGEIFLSGSVVALNGALTGSVMAHEVGHDLGLDHIDGLDADDVDEADEIAELDATLMFNLMFPVAIAGGGVMPLLTGEQGEIMKEYCLVKSGCV
jgi:hypothetical protein